jgi:hypothetical protein
MTEPFMAALFLNYGALAGAVATRTPSYLRSQATNSIAFLLIPLGTIAAFGALALFIHDKGIGYGLLNGLLSLIAFGLTNVLLRSIGEGIVSLLGLVSIGIGIAIALPVVL